MKGFIFLGTPHKGSQLTAVGNMISILGYWKDSSTILLDIVKPESQVNERLHYAFTCLLREGCGVANTVCVFETVKEAVHGFPITHVRPYSLSTRSARLITFQVVKRDSAVIDGAQVIGSEKGHRDIQRYASRNDSDYQDILVWIQKWVEEETQSKLGMH